MPIFKKTSEKENQIIDPLQELRQFHIKNPIPLNENKIVNEIMKFGRTSLLENENKEDEVTPFKSFKSAFDQYIAEKRLSKYIKDKQERKVSLG